MAEVFVKIPVIVDSKSHDHCGKKCPHKRSKKGEMFRECWLSGKPETLSFQAGFDGDRDNRTVFCEDSEKRLGW